MRQRIGMPNALHQKPSALADGCLLMLGFIKRIKADRQADIRRRELMAEQDARIAEGFGALRTAAELVAQAASGRGPIGEVVEIGDGFFVERSEDGTTRTVLLPNSVLEPHVARVDRFTAHIPNLP